MRFSQSPIVALAAAILLMNPAFAQTTTGGPPNLSSVAASESAAAASSTAVPSQAGTSIQSSTPSITGGSMVTATASIPTITGGNTATGTDTGLPKSLPPISGVFQIVAPSVPPTANAPYMQVSSLPEGTVFIVVGAVLGFMAMSVLLWRGLVAWSLHRSVRRAAAAQYTPDAKTLFRAPPAPFYKYSDRDSTLSLGLGGKNAKKGGRQPTIPGATSSSSLFFSPTAAAGTGGLGNAGNRGSSYLPAGYYASGTAQPGNGQGMAHIGHGHGGSISLSNLAPNGYTRARSIATPPDSPSLRPQSYSIHDQSYGASSSTLNLNTHGGAVRAPSAVLDDLFDGENAPPVPGHRRQGSTPLRY